MATAIIVENLCKRYELGALQQETQLRARLMGLLQAPFGKRRPREVIWALSDISFAVDEGELVGIIGRNGAGKSTLLKILSKITYPTSGRVRSRGRVTALLEVGAGFHDELTGRENIFLNGSIMGMRKREVDAKLEAIVEFSGLQRFIDTPIKRYSTGMRSRLGFSVAAHLDPDILIVDEVLSVGDADFQKKCISAMHELRGGGRTVLFVSHNMAAVENLCSRGIWLAQGKIQLDGPADKVIEAYMTSFASADRASVALANVKDRSGSGEARFTRVEYRSTNGDLQTVTRAGRSIVIRLHYRAREPVKYADFQLRLYTELGTLLTATSTWLHGLEIPLLPTGEGYVDLEIDSLNIVPGRYYFSLKLASLDRRVHDDLEHAVYLDVEEAPIHGQSRRYEGGRHGLVFFPQRWHLEGVAAAEPVHQAIPS